MVCREKERKRKVKREGAKRGALDQEKNQQAREHVGKIAGLYKRKEKLGEGREGKLRDSRSVG